MLRPLLEKWIDENMPRIVERALQRDAMLGRKTP
jgi:cell pole-organizing protein PopZ